MSSRLLWIGVASVLAALAWVLPPHLLGQIENHYPPGHSTWLGDALWNAMPIVTLPLLLAIGLAFGYLDPKDWSLAWLFGLWIVPISLAIDTSHNPTSHNLWPFEVGM